MPSRFEGRGETSAILTMPEGVLQERAVIVAHGAGNDRETPLLVAFSEGLARAGFPVLRFNFLYTEHGRKAPDRQEVLYAAWRGAYDFMEESLGSRGMSFIAAGKSLGGRMASMMVAEGLLPVEGLIFLGYPLHAMDNKEMLRDEHLYSITRPMLFFAGTRDPLCAMNLLEGVLKRLRAPWELYTVEGGDHSFHVPKSLGETEEMVFGRIVEKSIEWLKRR